jgi:hypothetical protein
MKPLPLNREIERVARRVIWFEEPPQAIADVNRFVAYAMTFGDDADMRIIRQFLGDDDLRYALEHAPAGIFDPRSWAYWNLKLGRYPAPAMPERQIPTREVSTSVNSRSANCDPTEDDRR